MKDFTIIYTPAGYDRTTKTDWFKITEGEEFEFEDGYEKVENSMDAIRVFEIIAQKWWETGETRDSIIEVKVTNH